MNIQAMVLNYFHAEERGDVDAVVEMCSKNAVVRNAANPPQHGRDGVRAYVTSFRDRTSHRRFDVLRVAEHDGVAYARWKADLTFKAGVTFGAVTTRRSFDFRLDGICRFKLDRSGLFKEIGVFHETTTAMQLAKAAAA